MPQTNYLEWIREGDIADPFLETALIEVERRQYSMSTLRSALVDGLRILISRLQACVDEGHGGMEDSKRKYEQNLEDLLAGRETVIWDEIKIPCG